MSGVIWSQSVISLASARLPDVYPLDSYGWTWAGANSTARSGIFTDGGAFPCFDASANHGPTWVAGVGVYGHNVARISGPGSSSLEGGANCITGNATFTPQKRLYTRWNYTQSNPFNFGTFFDPGGASNQNVVKGMRWKKSDTSFLFTWGPAPGGGCYVHCDDGTPIDLSHEAATFNFNDHLGEAHWFEVLLDITTPSACVIQMWIDDVLQLNYVYDASGIVFPGDSIGNLQVDGTVNAPNGAFTEDYTEIAMATYQLHIPPL